MNRVYGILGTAAVCLWTTAATAQNWVDFNDETSTRLVNGTFTGAIDHANDNQEKDYAWGDVDQDGDIDLVVVRKQPFTTPGKRTNALFLNEGIAEGHAINGVLVDHTDLYVTDSDISGDLGFLTATNDRDVALADVTGDGWLDIITAVTLTDNQAKNLSHPRIYRNKGEVGGVWQGFVYEDFRIPQMHPNAGPRFCSLSAGDVDHDGDLDLYFGDYDSGGAQIFDFNNRLLINGYNGDPEGVFTDRTAQQLTTQMSLAAFGAASEFADVNGDGNMDIIKQTSLNAPTHVAITYNNSLGNGNFATGGDYDTIYSSAPYFVNQGDLNNDGKIDLIIVDDGTDVYMLNEGNDAQGEVNWSQHSFSGSGGFGGNALIRDLDNDGFGDVIITDVDVDISGCSRTTFIYQNQGSPEGGTPSMAQIGNPIPANQLTGVHDAAVFDINGDGWLDIVMGRCNGTQVWMNQPPGGLTFAFTGGVPGILVPGQTTPIELTIQSTGTAEPEDGSTKMFHRVNGGSLMEIPLTLDDAVSNTYSGEFPAFECTDVIEFFFSTSDTSGNDYRDPPSAPTIPYTALVADGTVSDRNTFEDPADDDDWTVENDPSLTAGAWEVADPNATSSNGQIASPEDDASNGPDVLAFITQNGLPGGAAGAADVDGGPTYLVSNTIDLDGADGTIQYDRWFASIGGVPDVMTVEVSNDNGASWVSVPEHTTAGTSGVWQGVSFVVSDYVVPTAQIKVRFAANDTPNDSVTEAGIDNFEVVSIVCDGPVTCDGDSNNDGVVDVTDLVNCVLDWGTDGSANGGDVNGSGLVDVEDLVMIILAWGVCPGA